MALILRLERVIDWDNLQDLGFIAAAPVARQIFETINRSVYVESCCVPLIQPDPRVEVVCEECSLERGLSFGSWKRCVPSNEGQYGHQRWNNWGSGRCAVNCKDFVGIQSSSILGSEGSESIAESYRFSLE